MDNMENSNNLFDLGSAPVAEDFDPFAMDEELLDEGAAAKNDSAEDTAQPTKEDNTTSKQAEKESKESVAKTPVSGPEMHRNPKLQRQSQIWRKNYLYSPMQAQRRRSAILL